MPLISPARNNSSVPGGSLNPEIELLKKSGIIKTGDGIEGHFLSEMSEVGLDSRSILSRIATIMDSGESDGVKLSAAKLALMLHMHPALVPKVGKEQSQAPTITFVVNTPVNANTPLNLAAILTPAPHQPYESENE